VRGGKDMKGNSLRKYILIPFVASMLVFGVYGFLVAQPKVGPAPSAVIATADGESPGVRVEVTELKRVSGGTINLKFVMINDSDKKVDFGYSFVDRGHDVVDFKSIGGVHLIDAAGKKKYFVVRDSEKKCVCSQNLKDLQPKSRMNLWAKFPAPPDNVEKISVVIPHFMPMDDVPISR
jgi:hypothetical protein